jgi:hypothetical protein
VSALDTADWRHSAEQARALLIEGVCPVCGTSGWKSPLNHVARKHGIDNRTMRDACDLTVSDKVTDPELSERIAERTRELDMSKVNGPGRPRVKQQWTSRGRATNNAIIAAANQDPKAPLWRAQATAKSSVPEARAKQGASPRRASCALRPPEEDA